MPITNVVPSEKGGPAWGWNTDTNAWVPVDPNVVGGSMVGNLVRGAGLGFRQIGQGIDEALYGSNDPNVRAAGQVLNQQIQSAENAAPWTIALGMGVPDVLAGGVAAAATGGMALPEIIGGQALAAFGTGMMKPGSMDERVTNAEIGAIIAGGATGASIAAVKGIKAALGIGKVVADSSQEVTAKGVLTGFARKQNAEVQAEIDAATAEGRSATAGVRQPGSVGAAATPEDVIDPQTAVEGQAMNAMDRTAFENPTTADIQGILDRGQKVGVQPAYWALGEKDSMARKLGALGEFSPFGDPQEMARVEGNQMAVNRAAAMAAGAATTIDPIENTNTRISIVTLQKMRDWLDQGQDALKKELPGQTVSDMRRALDSVEISRGTTGAGQIFDDLRSTMLKNMSAMGDHAVVDPKDFINDTRNISRLVAEAAGAGDSISQEALIELNNKLYDLAEKTTKLARRDTTITGRGWAELRREEQMYMYLNSRGVLDKQGNVNHNALINLMKKPRSKGGWGINGPPESSAQRPIWDAAWAQAQNDSMQPPTGARVLGVLGGMTRNALRSQAARAGGAGALGYGVANSIWGNGR